MEQKFVMYMYRMFGKLPDDSFYVNMKPCIRAWLYENWLGENNG